MTDSQTVNIGSSGKRKIKKKKRGSISSPRLNIEKRTLSDYLWCYNIIYLYIIPNNSSVVQPLICLSPKSSLKIFGGAILKKKKTKMLTSFVKARAKESDRGRMSSKPKKLGVVGVERP